LNPEELLTVLRPYPAELMRVIRWRQGRQHPEQRRRATDRDCRQWWVEERAGAEVLPSVRG